MPLLPIFLFFSGLSIGLFLGPIIVHFLTAWSSTRRPAEKLTQPGG